VDCGSSVDDAEHTLSVSDRWWRPRRALEDVVQGDFEPDNGLMMESMEK